MNQAKIDSEYEALKRELLSVGLPIPGTLHELYARCGSKTCPCFTDNAKRHGPYIRWHHKTNGRQYAVGIDEKVQPLIEGGIKNREKLENLFKKMMVVGATYAEYSVSTKKTLNGYSKKS
jgi:hypothetical protein